ncbi:Eukaryotic translation initiation factor 3 subunit E [Desmophyllum pertusum]|uniref:Eukaryotic translation initiation factor 3 subunit E n=1 Tax=Desmophyllum pertusum TaxID=174260 RepID=A0A9W9YFR1_9CNID|nr:Eukaryotic translation initiation factor 3 subunit E [Desmophyllum pertusum]
MDVFKNLIQTRMFQKGEVNALHDLVEIRTEVVYTVENTFKLRQNLLLNVLKILSLTIRYRQTRDGRQLFDYLEMHHGIKPEMLDTLYKYAKFQYECGNYSGAAEYLYFYRVLVPGNDDRNTLNALWGKLGSEILMQNWETALEDLNRLKDVIESNNQAGTLQLLQERTWLIHWSLFVFFNHPKGRDLIIDLFLYQPQYLNAIQTTCPHILRYLTTAVITNKRRRTVLKDLVKVIQQESYTYKDPITEFLECLYVNFDFDGAQQKLRECETVLLNDFFLVACLDDFIEMPDCLYLRHSAEYTNASV